MFFIVGINVVLKEAVIMIFKTVGCQTESGLSSYITFFIFLCTFFNTGFLLLIINANFKGQGFLAYLFNKKELTDFNSKWFHISGDTIISSMVLNIGVPPMTEICMGI